MGNKEGIAPRRYDEKFKEGALRLVTEQGRPSKEVVAELGICIDTLRNWLKAAGEPPPRPSGPVEPGGKTCPGAGRTQPYDKADDSLLPVACPPVDETAESFRAEESLKEHHKLQT
ncbi:transposase [Acutalibacter muris]|uniref:Transposase n=1 Tax=Acutalibacter muris TaxID=1796620 RepID=A0AA92QV15_9FIRM|nr:transposase [Acutalibacter muris]